MHLGPKELCKVPKTPPKAVTVFFFQMEKGKFCELYKV